MNIQSLKDSFNLGGRDKIALNPKNFSGFIGGIVLALIVAEFVFLTSHNFFSVSSIQARSLIGERFKDYVANNSALSPKISKIPSGSLPENETRKVEYSSVSTVTAYNSEAAQCDASPCITANGYNLCTSQVSNTVAANHLPLGAKIRIPELFGSKVFVVRDRMNSRYYDRVDVWMKNKTEAINFGVKRASIEVLE